VWCRESPDTPRQIQDQDGQKTNRQREVITLYLDQSLPQQAQCRQTNGRRRIRREQKRPMYERCTRHARPKKRSERNMHISTRTRGGEIAEHRGPSQLSQPASGGHHLPNKPAMVRGVAVSRVATTTEWISSSRNQPCTSSPGTHIYQRATNAIVSSVKSKAPMASPVGMYAALPILKQSFQVASLVHPFANSSHLVTGLIEGPSVA
jgi:hypothetical protein